MRVRLVTYELLNLIKCDSLPGAGRRCRRKLQMKFNAANHVATLGLSLQEFTMSVWECEIIKNLIIYTAKSQNRARHTHSRYTIFINPHTRKGKGRGKGALLAAPCTFQCPFLSFPVILRFICLLCMLPNWGWRQFNCLLNQGHATHII